MADLSRSSFRRTAQDRITNNRDTIAPLNRDTRSDAVQVRSSLRDAFRGDPQSEAIRQFLGQSQRTVEAYYDHDLTKRREQAEADFAKGSTDAASGAELDPALSQSVAYQRAFYSTTATARQQEFETETAQEVERRINAGATPDDIDEFLNERNRAFITEAGDLFSQPDVQRQVANRLVRFSTDLDNRASAMMKEKTDRELVDLTVGNVVAAIQRGEGFDLASEIGRLTEAGLNGETVKESLVNGIVAYSQETGDTTVLQNLLDARDPNDPDVIAFRTAIEGQPLPPVDAPAPAAPTLPPERQTYVAPVANIDRVTSGIGARRAPLPGASTNHGGIDIAMPVGTAVMAPADGVVEVAGVRGRGGKTLIIRHADGSTTGFAHLDNIGVKLGDTVTQGQQVAASGNTGNSTGPHLHWTYRDAKGERKDPRTIVGSKTQAMEAAPAANVETASAEIEPARRPRAPGRSLLSPAQQVRILNAIDSIEGDTERKTEQARQAAKDELTMDLWTRAQRGEDVSDTIEQAVRSNVLEPGEGMSLSNTFRTYRDSTLEGEADDDLVLRYGAKFAANNPNYASITAQADRDYRAGLFGTGRAATRAYLEIRTRAASGARGDAGRSPAEQQVVGNARSYVSASLRTMTGGGTGVPVPQHMLRFITQGENEFERRIAAGEDPMVAAEAIIKNYTGFIRPSTATLPPGGGNPRAPGSTATSGQQAQLTYIPGQGIAPAR